MKIALAGAFVASAVSIVAPVAHADRAEPLPLYGHYNLFIDFSKQTFNGMPTPMNPITVPVEFTTTCDVSGCVAHMDNTDDHARNPGAPVAYEYRWNNDRWETSGVYPYFCDRNNPGSAVQAQRSDYWMPNPDGSFFGERTLVIGGAGCPGEGPGTQWLPISLTPTDPPSGPAQ
ncbi:MBOE_33420 family protein [Mycolicibacterium lutetiense]